MESDNPNHDKNNTDNSGTEGSLGTEGKIEGDPSIEEQRRPYAGYDDANPAIELVSHSPLQQLAGGFPPPLDYLKPRLS